MSVKTEKRPYYEKYVVGDDPDSPISPYYEKYAVQESPIIDQQAKSSSKGIRGQLERKVASPAVEFLTKAATSIPEFGKSISKLGMQGVNALLGQFGAGISPEEFEQVSKIIQSIGPLGNVPDEEEISKSIKQVTGGRLEPQTSAEKILKKGAGIAGSVVGFGPEAALGTPLKAAGTAALAGTTASLEESGVNPWLSLGGGVLADFATKSAGNIGKRLLSFLKAPAKTAGEAVSKLASVKPEQIKQEVKNAASRLGISQSELPLSAQLDNPALQRIEESARSSALAGKSLEKQLKGAESKIKTAYEDIGNQLSQRQGLLPNAVSEEAVRSLQNVEEKLSETYRKAYAASSRNLPKNAVSKDSIGKAVLKQVDEKIRDFSKGAGTPAKDTLVSRLKRFKAYIQKIPGADNGKIPIQDLIDLKQDLNQIIKYEVKGGVDKALNPLANITRNAIQDYGKSNQPFLFNFNEAERMFAQTARDFRKNTLIKSLSEGKNPEQIFNAMKRRRTIRELEKVFSTTPEGKESFDAVKKYMLENIIGSKLLDKKGNISWGNASGMFKNANNRDILQEIVGPKNFNVLKDIEKVTGGIEEGLRKFFNSSGTASKGFDLLLLVTSPIKAFQKLMTGHPIQASKEVGLMFSPYVMSQLFTNPEFIQSVQKASLAGKGSSAQAFEEAAKKVASMVSEAIQSDQSSQNEG